MNKSLNRAIAATAVFAAGLAGALATSPTAVAGQGARPTQSAKPAPTGFGFKGDVFGTKVLVDGVELRNAKDAYAQQRCTSLTGRDVVKNSTLSVPDNGLIHAAATSSFTKTYRDAAADVVGIRGVTTVGDLRIGDFEGQTTPTISLAGLRSVADAFHGPSGFGHQETFTAGELAIGNLPSEIPQELQDLLNALTATGGEVVGQVVTELTTATGGVIEIPGLGSIGLAGVKSGSTSPTHATSETYALRIQVDATGHPTVLQLGRARTRIAKPTPAGVFRSTAMGLDMLSGDLVHLGNIGQRSIPCEGTGGEVKRQDIADATVLGGLVNLTGIHYAFMGKQRKDGSGNGMVASNLDTLTIDSIGLQINGIKSKVLMRKPAGTTRVQKTISTSVGEILLDGEAVALPQPGQVIELGEGSGNFLQYRVVKKDYYGAEVHALRLTLGDSFTPGGSVLDLGWAAGKIFAR